VVVLSMAGARGTVVRAPARRGGRLTARVSGLTVQLRHDDVAPLAAAAALGGDSGGRASAAAGGSRPKLAARSKSKRQKGGAGGASEAAGARQTQLSAPSSAAPLLMQTSYNTVGARGPLLVEDPVWLVLWNSALVMSGWPLLLLGFAPHAACLPAHLSACLSAALQQCLLQCLVLQTALCSPMALVPVCLSGCLCACLRLKTGRQQAMGQGVGVRHEPGAQVGGVLISEFGVDGTGLRRAQTCGGCRQTRRQLRSTRRSRARRPATLCMWCTALARAACAPPCERCWPVTQWCVDGG
jgi:hypothetical protein